MSGPKLSPSSPTPSPCSEWASSCYGRFSCILIHGHTKPKVKRVSKTAYLFLFPGFPHPQVVPTESVRGGVGDDSVRGGVGDGGGAGFVLPALEEHITKGGDLCVCVCVIVY